MPHCSSNRVALITGANKGIGYEVALKLIKQNVLVVLGCRDRVRAISAAARLRREVPACSVRTIPLNVTIPQTVQNAADAIARDFGALDILVNNVGICIDAREKPSKIAAATVRETYEVNVFGLIAVTQAMLPLLLASSSGGRIVNLSSSLGSMSLGRDPNAISNAFPLLAYNSSKAAVNSITVQLANELRSTPIKINAACPGFCATDLNGHQGLRSAADGARIVVELATLSADGPSGGFFDEQGPVPW